MLKGGLVLTWELDMNLGSTLIYRSPLPSKHDRTVKSTKLFSIGLAFKKKLLKNRGKWKKSV